MLPIRSMMAWATVSAALIRTGTSTANRVRWSIIERTYLHSIPAAEVDTDLYSTKSTDTLWKGRSTGKWPVGSFGLLCAVFVVNKLGIVRTSLAHRGLWSATNISGGFCRKSV